MKTICHVPPLKNGITKLKTPCAAPSPVKSHYRHVGFSSECDLGHIEKVVLRKAVLKEQGEKQGRVFGTTSWPRFN